MNKYELGVVYRAGLDEETMKAEVERVQGIITRFGGVIEKVDNWGRRKLAYPIQKQTDGVFSFITFTAEGSAQAEIESRVRIIENVLRYLITRVEA